MAMNPEYDYLFKLLLIGDSGVGKSCLQLAKRRWPMKNQLFLISSVFSNVFFSFSELIFSSCFIPAIRRWHLLWILHLHDRCWFQNSNNRTRRKNYKITNLGHRRTGTIPNNHQLLLPRCSRYHCCVWCHRPRLFW